MKFKFLKAAFAGLIFTLSGYANAGIIDYNSYTEVNGLDWLDWTSTVGLTQTQALALNTGWRTASELEMESLMNEMFATTFAFDANGIDGTNVNVNFPTLTSNFISLFGSTTTGTDATYATAESSGLVGFDSATYAGLFSSTSPSNQAYGQPGFFNSQMAIALVRDGSSTSVPEPATLAIFTLGLLGLASRRFKQ